MKQEAALLLGGCFEYFLLENTITTSVIKISAPEIIKGGKEDLVMTVFLCAVLFAVYLPDYQRLT